MNIRHGSRIIKMPNYNIIVEQRLKLRKEVTINADKALDALKEAYERFGDEISLTLEDKVPAGEQVSFYAVSVDKEPVLTTKEEEELEKQLLDGMCLAEGLDLHNRLMRKKEALKTVLKDLEILRQKAMDNDVYHIFAYMIVKTGVGILLYDAIPAEISICLADNKLYARTESYNIVEEIGFIGGHCKEVCKTDIPALIAEQWDKVWKSINDALDKTISLSREKEYAPEARVYLVAGGGCKHLFHEGSKKECEDLCETYGWEFKDENEFIWSMEIEELD